MVLANNEIHPQQQANKFWAFLEGALALYTVYLGNHSRVDTYSTKVIGLR